MDAESWKYISEAIRYISTSLGILGVSWAVAWMLVNLRK